MLYAAGINSLASQYGSKSNEDENESAKDIVLSVHNNLTAAYVKEQKWQKAIQSSSKVLSLCPEDDPNIKALYRRATAHFHLGDRIKAASDLEVAMNKWPNGAYLICLSMILSACLRSLSPTDPGLRQLAQKVADAEEKLRAESQAKMKGFLNSGSKGKGKEVESK